VVLGVVAEVARVLSLRLELWRDSRICTSVHLSKECLKGLGGLNKLILRRHSDTKCTRSVFPNSRGMNIDRIFNSREELSYSYTKWPPMHRGARTRPEKFATLGWCGVCCRLTRCASGMVASKASSDVVTLGPSLLNITFHVRSLQRSSSYATAGHLVGQTRR
jgi:hypothetical protein